MTRISLFIIAILIATVGTNAAIYWDPQIGYSSDETELSGMLPEEVAQVLKWMNDGRRAEESGRYKAALRRYKKVTKKHIKSQYAPEALFRTAQIRLAQNKIDHAFDAFHLTAMAYPNYGSFNSTIGEMYKIALDRLENHRVKIFGVIPGFLNLDRAIKYFEQIVFLAPHSDYAALSLMNISRAWDKKKDDTMTIYALERLVTNYPGSLLAPDAYLQLAKEHADQIKGPYYDQRSTEHAITFFEDFLIQYPANNGVGDAEDGLADAKDIKAMSKLKIADYYYYKRNNLSAAKILYNESITIAPRSPTAERARDQLAKVDAKLEEIAGTKKERQAPSLQDMQQKAKKRAKRKVLGIF